MTDASPRNVIDRFSIAVGQATSWLMLLMVLTTCVIVILRYVFDTGVIWLQQSLTWMHAGAFMLGAAYTLQADEHVRVDVFYRGMSARGQAWVNLLGILVFLWPMCAYLLFESWKYVSAAWKIREFSGDAGGLPFPAIPLLKTVLLLMPLTVALQGLSLALASLRNIRSGS